jgi:hypothetical protein
MRDLRQEEPRGASLYDSVRAQLSSLVGSFGLEGQRAQVMRAYEIICRESLLIPMGMRPPEFSRINADGTPFQYSLTLGSGRPSLQFLSEAGVPGSSVADRMKEGRERIGELAALLGVGGDFSRIEGLLDRAAPPGDNDLSADPSGAFWIGASWSPAAPPKMTVYVNDRWGGKRGVWDRLEEFISFFGETRSWKDTREALSSGMKPLGMAATLGGGSPPRGRAYLSAYGNPLPYYRDLVRSATDASFCDLFEQFVATLLGEDRLYPLRSVVCSYGLGKGSGADFKFELCGHCSLLSDAQAEERLLDWLRLVRADPAPYAVLLKVLTGGTLSGSLVDVHSYMGIGSRDGGAYSTIYLKPSWSRSSAPA